jgi:hypothetical protein
VTTEPTLDEFEAAQSKLRRSGYPSWYERVTSELDAERIAALDAALAAPHLTGRAISIVLKTWGFDVSPATVGTYRRQLRG